MWEYAFFITLIEQGLDSIAALLTVVNSPFIHVHGNEPVGGCCIETATELERVGQGFFTVIQAVLDALFQNLGNLQDGLLFVGAAHCSTSERQRELGLFVPPLPQIHNFS